MIQPVTSAILAGLLVVCGNLEVQASPFSINVGVITGADGSANFTLTGETTKSTASFSYHENNQANDFLNFVSTDFTVPAAAFTRSGFTSGPDGIGTTNAINFNVFDPAYLYTIDNTDGSSQTIKGFSLAFTLFQRVSPEGFVYQYDTVFSSPTLLGSAFESANSFTNVTGNPLSPVPLPASLPMFGAAVLAVGGVGYGAARRRRS